MAVPSGTRCPGLRRALPQGLVFAALTVLALLSAGCRGAPGPIFEALTSPVVWPPPPAPARIRYVGALRTSADLKPARGFLASLGNLLTGARKPERMYGPRAAVCTPGGECLWVADQGGRCVHLFDLKNRSYRRITRAGRSRLLSPVALCLGPGDSVYVCDSEAAAVHRLGAHTGEWIESLPLPPAIRRPAALAHDAAARRLYVVDVVGHDVKVLGLDGRLLRTIGRRGTRPGEFNYPTGICLHGRELWVVDSGNHRVQGLTREGRPIVAFGSAGDAPGDLALPKGVAFDSEGHVYVVDARFENVQIFDRGGRLLLFFGEEGVGPGQFWLPAGIFIDRNDRIWICDTYNGRVQVFDYIRRR